MTALRIVLLAAAVAISSLAGCLGSEPEPTTTTPTGTSTPSTTPSTTPSSTPPTQTTPPTGSDTPAPGAVAIQSFAFAPAVLEVETGAKVVWTNKDLALHTVDGDGGLSSGDMNQNDVYEFTFIQAGTYEYVCAYHSNMKGTVKVGVGETVKEEEPPVGDPSKVAIKDFAFAPSPTTVAAGTTLTWTNMDSSPHSVVLDDGTYDSGLLSQNAQGSRQFAAAGTFDYHCGVHPNMKGRVVVT